MFCSSVGTREIGAGSRGKMSVGTGGDGGGDDDGDGEGERESTSTSLSEDGLSASSDSGAPESCTNPPPLCAIRFS